MDNKTYRFRFLIYFAAFMLVMSVCFVYAEPMPSPNHLLFQSAPQHSGFLAPSSVEPSFDPSALRAATAPVVSPAMMQQLQDATHGRHSFLHRSRRTNLRVVPANTQSESSILDLKLQPAPTSLGAR